MGDILLFNIPSLSPALFRRLHRSAPLSRRWSESTYIDLKFSSLTFSIFPGGPNGCLTACTAVLTGWEIDRGVGTGVLIAVEAPEGVDQARTGLFMRLLGRPRPRALIAAVSGLSISGSFSEVREVGDARAVVAVEVA